jgi:hypothetical protein
VEVTNGEHAGLRGVICQERRHPINDVLQVKVLFSDGSETGFLLHHRVLSSGSNRSALLVEVMQRNEVRDRVRSACSMLSRELKKALSAVRNRVANDELPLLSLLQIEPLKLQSSHLSFQVCLG